MRSPFTSAAPVVGLALAILAANHASAGLSYVAQQRWVRTNAFVAGQFDDDEQFAAGFNPFNAVSTSSAANAGQAMTARATQQSTLGTDSISFAGDLSATIGAVGGPTGESFAETWFSITFDLAAAGQAVRLHGALDQTTHDQTFETIVQLRGPGGDIVGIFSDQDELVSIDQIENLADGRYQLTLYLFTEISRGSPPPAASLDFSLTLIPSPGAAGLCVISTLFLARRRR